VAVPCRSRHREKIADEADAKEGPRASIAFVLFSVHGFVRLSALAFGKFFERGGRIFFTCIWSAANRPERLLVPKLANDDFALITLALADDIIILRHLWTVYPPPPGSNFVLASAHPGTCSTAIATRTTGGIRMSSPFKNAGRAYESIVPRKGRGDRRRRPQRLWRFGCYSGGGFTGVTTCDGNGVTVRSVVRGSRLVAFVSAWSDPIACFRFWEDSSFAKPLFASLNFVRFLKYLCSLP